jgi:glycosyltransferase involved in cell wall biosynthesis
VPTVSIGLPVYNGARFLRLALDSLLAQDYTDFEVVVSDNASTDDTSQILEDFERRDPRVRVLRQAKNLGAVANFAEVFRKSSAPYFMWAAHDDLWDRRFVGRCVELLDGDPGAVLAMSRIGYLDETGNVYGYNDNIVAVADDVVARAHEIVSRVGWFAAYGLIRRSALQQTQLLGPRYGSDVCLLLQLLLMGRFLIDKEPLFFYRVVPASVKNAAEQAEALLPGNTAPTSRQYTQLLLDLLQTLRDSNIDDALKSAVAADFVRTIAFANADWRSRILSENGYVGTAAGAPAAVAHLFTAESPVPFNLDPIDSPASPKLLPVRHSGPTRRKIVITNTFPVYPPRQGGAARICGLYSRLAKHFDIEMITIGDRPQGDQRIQIAPGFIETRIARTEQYEQTEIAIWHQLGGISGGDIAFPQLYPTAPNYVGALRQACAGAAYVLPCHPYTLPAVLECWNGPLLYEAQDLEYPMKAALLPQNDLGKAFLNNTGVLERQCLERATLVITMSRNETEAIERFYEGIDRSKFLPCPHGIDTADYQFLTLPRRHRAKAAAGLERPVAIFLGSIHPPNVDAARHVVRCAAELPEIAFLIVGSVIQAFNGAQITPNVSFMGEVDDVTKDNVFSIADVALNPMTAGAGVNIKMLEYFAWGIPVVSSPHGARGLELADGVHALLRSPAAFTEAIGSSISQIDAAQDRAIRAYAHLVANFSWEQTIARLVERIT